MATHIPAQAGPVNAGAASSKLPFYRELRVQKFE